MKNNFFTENLSIWLHVFTSLNTTILHNTRWPILIYNPKYLLKYFIYEKMVWTKVDHDRGGHLTFRLIFKVT